MASLAEKQIQCVPGGEGEGEEVTERQVSGRTFASETSQFG